MHEMPSLVTASLLDRVNDVNSGHPSAILNKQSSVMSLQSLRSMVRTLCIDVMMIISCHVNEVVFKIQDKILETLRQISNSRDIEIK
jgi:hypothetical protein